MEENINKKIKGPDEKFCVECGAIIKANAQICPKCGVSQAVSKGSIWDVAPNGKSKIIAALLAIFLGGLGIHKFYFGQKGLGILYLVFFWAGIPWIIAFVEGILFLCMSDERFNSKYGGA